MITRLLGVSLKILSPSLQRPISINVVRGMSSHHGPRTMVIIPSRFQWNKFKYFLHMYFMIGIIPVVIILTVGNYFIGPATLEPIPEGYHPKHWEYHRHFLTRFLAKYVFPSDQQDYEKTLAFFHDEDNQVRYRKLKAEIKRKMRERDDYKLFYYEDPYAKYIRVNQEDAVKARAVWGVR